MQTERENRFEAGEASTALRLSGEEIALLTKQGSVCAEDRGHRRVPRQ
jgi:hypothetical protein